MNDSHIILTLGSVPEGLTNNLPLLLINLLANFIAFLHLEEKIIFLRSIAKGTGDKSYGIHVGKMAGLPESVIERAHQILHSYTKEQPKNVDKNKNESILKSIEDYEPIKNLKKQIDSIDINNTFNASN